MSLIALSSCCPKNKPKTVKVEVPCELPPGPTLPNVPFDSGEKCSSDHAVCFTPEQALNLELWLKRSKRWIEETKATCGKK